MTCEVMDPARLVRFDDDMTSALRTDVTESMTGTLERVERMLRLVLRINAASSAFSGMVLALAPASIDEWLGTGHPQWIRLVGVLLVPFALGVAWLSTLERDRLRRHVPAVIAGDVAWVVASLVTVLVGWYDTEGAFLVGAMALAVDVFAGLQWWTWRRLGN